MLPLFMLFLTVLRHKNTTYRYYRILYVEGNTKRHFQLFFRVNGKLDGWNSVKIALQCIHKIWIKKKNKNNLIFELGCPEVVRGGLRWPQETMVVDSRVWSAGPAPGHR